MFRCFTALLLCHAFFYGSSFGQDSGGPKSSDKPTKATQNEAPKSKELAKFEPFKLSVSAKAGRDEFVADLHFVDRRAVEYAGGKSIEPVAVYDLSAMSWKDMKTGKTITLADCEAWAAASRKRSEDSLTKSGDAKFRSFFQAMLAPNFQVKQDARKLVLSNEHFRYEVRETQEVAAPRRAAIYAYDRLNAYRKAMIERKVPPFAQLSVTNEIAARQLMPSEMKVRITSATGSVNFQVQMKVSPLSVKEREQAQAAIEK